MEKTRTNKIVITLLSVGAVTLGISMSAYSWVFFEMQQTVTQIANITNETQILATQNAHAQTVRRIVRDTQDERSELDTYFLIEDDIVTFFADLENLGTSAGVNISVSSVKVGKPLDNDKFITPLTLTLESAGSLRQVFHTLALLEAYPKALQITQTRIVQHPSEDSWQGTFAITAIKIDTSASE
ncbi:hypothetical protein COB18_03020 [Candidatus Kaiserbacteria bacterium]|nr:MAG: hypothetical protein COB18_03020 [Candidatus Kaiserbacteria bacterium]